MSHVLELLQEMRRRNTGMFIGKPSIIRLRAFLDGYDLAAERLGGKAPDSILPDFCDWIHQRAVSTQHGWEEWILQNSADDADALEKFWKLLDEFLALRGTDTVASRRSEAGALPPVPPLTPGTVTKTG